MNVKIRETDSENGTWVVLAKNCFSCTASEFIK